MNLKTFLTIFFLFCACVGVFAQQQSETDFLVANYRLTIEQSTQEVSGYGELFFDVIKPMDSIFIDAHAMQFKNVMFNNAEVKHNVTTNKLWIYDNFKPSENNVLSFHYKANPKQTMYFLGWDNEVPNQIWTQGQGKYTSHWLPSFDDVNEKVIFNLSVNFNADYKVLSNGLLKDKITVNETVTRWNYQMQQPMSSYLVALAIGDYEVKIEHSKSGTPLEMYYYPKDSLKVESTYRYTKDIFNFLEDEIGVNYPWQIHRQVPVHDFLYAGMENTTLTIFSDSYIVDNNEFNDKNYVNINAHELAHHWFGNLVTATSSEHHWLQEGFSTYYALLAERQMFGDDYFYWRLYEYANQLKAQQQSGNATALLNAKASSLTFYQKGAIALYMMKSKVGDSAFKQAVAKYLNKFAYKSAETKDFIAEVEAESNVNLSKFVAKWLKENSFDYDAVLNQLKSESELIRDYEMIDCEVFQSKCNDYINMPLHPKIKSKLIAQLPQLINKQHFSENPEVRQTIALRLNTINNALKPYAETLLNDESYETVEMALYKLWTNFPEERAKYLNQTKHLDGNRLKNVRLLWLTLAIVTPQYDDELKNNYINELINYSSKNYNFEMRQATFGYLQMLNLWTTEALANLQDASKHHQWQFKSFAKDLIAQLSTQPELKDYFNTIKTN